MMCQFDELYFAPEGYVVYCRQCHYYQMCFGTTVVTLTATNLMTLHHSAGELLVVHQDCPDEDLKQIILPTPYEGAHLMLSRKELSQLHQMLEEVSDEVTALSLMELFDAP